MFRLYEADKGNTRYLILREFSLSTNSEPEHKCRSCMVVYECMYANYPANALKVDAVIEDFKSNGFTTVIQAIEYFNNIDSNCVSNVDVFSFEEMLHLGYEFHAVVYQFSADEGE